MYNYEGGGGFVGRHFQSFLNLLNFDATCLFIHVTAGNTLFITSF